MKQRYESGERTADLISAYAGLKMEEVYKNRQPDMAKKDEAFKMVQDYFDGLKDKERFGRRKRVYLYDLHGEPCRCNCTIYDCEPGIDLFLRSRMIFLIELKNYTK